MRKKNDFLSVSEPVNAELEEHLSAARLTSLAVSKVSKNPIDHASRPKENFVDLMAWTEGNFSQFLSDKTLNCFIHNRIIVDGQFLQYCEMNKVTVDVLHKDSIVSWKTEGEFEKFFVQGVFLIKTKGLEFIHAALFHKGNQNEDEISFFILVSPSNYEAYVKFRNDFDSWVLQRDRSNLHIRVVEGEDIPYTRDHTWEDLFLPDSIKVELKNLVEGFLSSKEFYNNNNIPWKRGILMFGEPGCHVAGTEILMHDGSVKNVENIKLGDFVMGPDSKPREVLKLIKGNEPCYEVTPVKGNSFIVNENHILHLCYTSNVKKNIPKYLDVSVKELLSLSKPLQSRLKLKKSNCIEFNNNQDLLIDPYILGVWLGDGTTSEPEITSADQEIIDYCKRYAEEENLVCVISATKSKAFSIRFNRNSETDTTNKFNSKLKKLGIFDKKNIPEIYLTSSIENRLQLLAGLLDSDGSHSIFSPSSFLKFGKIDRKKGVFDFIQKDVEITKQIGFLVRSLGLGFTTKPCVKSIKKTGFTGTYYRSCIYGDIYKIPNKLPRKQAGEGSPNKDPLNIGIKSITPVGNNNYYGFIIDNDHLYLDGDFFIHHNCGKTSIIRTIISQYNFKPVTIVPGANDEAVREAFAYAEEQSPSLLYFEDLDSLLEKSVDISSFLNLMDGISAKNGLLVMATANNVNKLKTNITDRPSRFDRKFEIPLPDQQMSNLYLKKWFGTLISAAKCKELAKYAVQYKFSYAYLKELYISAMFESLANNRKVPTEKDISKALDRLMKDKNILRSGKTVKTDKYFSK